MTYASQYVRGMGFKVLKTGESGAVMAGVTCTSPKLQAVAAEHAVQNVAPTIDSAVVVT